MHGMQKGAVKLVVNAAGLVLYLALKSDAWPVWAVRVQDIDKSHAAIDDPSIRMLPNYDALIKHILRGGHVFLCGHQGRASAFKLPNKPILQLFAFVISLRALAAASVVADL